MLEQAPRSPSIGVAATDVTEARVSNFLYFFEGGRYRPVYIAATEVNLGYSE